MRKASIRKIILIVTSDLKKQSLLEALIRKHVTTATVYSALDAASGLAKLRNVPPHILITDYKFAKVGGPQFVDEVLSNRDYRSLAVIIGANLPEEEQYLDDLVSGRVQFLDESNEETEFTRCLFKALNFVSHGKNAEFHMKYLVKGDLLLKEGAKADFVFIVKKGQLRAFSEAKGIEVHLGNIGVGEFVGEMAYVSGETRSASVEALEDCELIEIPVGTLDVVLYRRPAWSKTLLQTLSKRLKEANERHTSNEY